MLLKTVGIFFGLTNNDSKSSYADACIQSLFHLVTVRRILTHYKDDDLLKPAFLNYVAKNHIDMKRLKQQVDNRYCFSTDQTLLIF